VKGALRLIRGEAREKATPAAWAPGVYSFY
jgi:hypothetical protein